MYSQESFRNFLFIDIETVSNKKELKDYVGSEESLIEHWNHKVKYVRKEDSELESKSNTEIYNSNAALYPEFGKVIVISIGQVRWEDGKPISKVRSFYGDNEYQVLQGFMETMAAIFDKNPNVKLVGHNINRFDIPYILKRCLINGIKIHYKFRLHEIKPWESCILDTTDIWKFGNYSGGAKLALICDLLNIPSPKETMEGKDVTNKYWFENALEDIKKYCEDDVVATMNVLLKISHLDIIQ